VAGRIHRIRKGSLHRLFDDNAVNAMQRTIWASNRAEYRTLAVREAVVFGKVFRLIRQCLEGFSRFRQKPPIRLKTRRKTLL
jgi:hypothetical protein